MVHPVNRFGKFTARDYLDSTTKRSLAQAWIDSGVPRWVTLVDELLFVVASLIFVAGSLDFFPTAPFEKYIEGCELYVAGSALYFALALFATYEIVEDARLSSRSISAWSLLEQVLYLLGSTFFVIGTILFTPSGEGGAAVAPATGGGDDAGGSVDSVRAISAPLFGRNFYVGVGDVPLPPDSSIMTGDELFVVGSVLFTVAAFVSALKAAGETSSELESVIRRRVSVACASLYELGGVAFVVGTLGFIPASSLGISACPDGPRTLESAGATLFVIGSVLYTVGSLLVLGFQAWRTYSYDGNTVSSYDGMLRSTKSAAALAEKGAPLHRGVASSGVAVSAPGRFDPPMGELVDVMRDSAGE